MTADEPFLRAIRHNPHDVLPIGVYADYLDESGSELLDAGQIESVREAWDRAQRGREEEARAIMSVLFLQLSVRSGELVYGTLSDGTPVSIPAGEAPSF